jgi:hypothetical protein
MTVTGNAVWNPWQGRAWGFCHMNYYPGEGGGLDNQIVQGNYWQGLPTLDAIPGFRAPDAHCQVTNNTIITAPSEVPKSIIDAAGLEPSFAHLLTWAEVLPSAP